MDAQKSKARRRAVYYWHNEYLGFEVRDVKELEKMLNELSEKDYQIWNIFQIPGINCFDVLMCKSTRKKRPDNT